MRMARIYVSSIFLDLKEHREQVSRVLRRMGHEDVAMEYYVAEDKRPVDKCLEDVADCDVYVGIFAWRYGWIPTKNNRKKLSITEMEYRKALATDKKCLIFLLDGKAPWSLDFVDRTREKIEKLRDELAERHGGDRFSTEDELGRKLAEALHQWAQNRGLVVPATSIPKIDLNAYYNGVRTRYQRLDLDALTPPQKEECLRLYLSNIFVEQSVRKNPPPVELPREACQRLHRDGEVHADDLPAGVTLDDTGGRKTIQILR
jgi:hypothetical protein